MSLSRRDLIKMGVVGGAALTFPLQRTVSAKSDSRRQLRESKLPKPFTLPFRVPPVLAPFRIDSTTDYYKVDMMPFTGEIIPGIKTPLWGYNGSVPGPTVKVERGRRTVMRHCNMLPATHPELRFTPWTSVHLHGSPSAPEYDGYASDITNPGQYKDYVYPNTQHARTMWYHDHGLHHTAENVLMGLAAQYHVVDSLERSLPIPHGDYDVPLIVSDAMFNEKGSLMFDNNSESGIFGDVILVNGVPWPVMKVARRKYRFRVLNGAISRSFRWYLDSGEPLVVIATDCGLMPTPQSTQRLRHGMAERYEIIIDFSKYPAGRRVQLLNESPDNNRDEDNTHRVMAFDVVGGDFDPAGNDIPDQLDPTNPVMALREEEAKRTTKIELVRKSSLWTINEHTWDHVVDSGFTLAEATPTEGDVEVWEIDNPSGGWFHPTHIHLVDFRILSRNGRPPAPYELGPKDVVYVGENEKVRLLMRFEGRGKYMIHCHNLVHEDHDMMSQFNVLPADGSEASDPMGVPCLDMPEQTEL